MEKKKGDRVYDRRLGVRGILTDERDSEGDVKIILDDGSSQWSHTWDLMAEAEYDRKAAAEKRLKEIAAAARAEHDRKMKSSGYRKAHYQAWRNTGEYVE